MDAISRLKLLSSQMSFEPDGERNPAAVPAATTQNGAAQPVCFTPKERDQAFVHPAQMPNGQQIMLLKTLLSSACERDCFYCPFRAGRDFRRATFKPDEFASLFGKLAQSGAAEGIFLSSGLANGGVITQDKLIDAAEILRKKHGFRGYIHLKIMPGAEKEQVFRAMQLADRISINLESPNTERLSRLAPHKVFMEELLRPLRWAEEIRRSQPAHLGWKGRWPSTVTQFVAGGADESDLELLTTTQWLHKNVRLKRAYFSAFHPIPDTPLENKAAVDPLREHRLYQASFLLRDYGFDLEDLPFANNENLPLQTDPKLAWAQMNLSETPIEINRAEKRDLLRIPGIGPKSADAILYARRQNKLYDLSALKKLGVIVERAAPYVLLNGRRPASQLSLF
ncbi:MAG: helix-hairpin-helix domain-containing protein [Chloroflexi bacterium]|nr:helix-hairpin-helix domain-containing protein [Chloroflexota bacterium]